MNDFSLIEKLKILMDIIVSSPLFFVCSIIGIAILIFLIICIILNKKINKYIFISLWSLIILIILIRYNSLMLNIIDNFFDSVFMALYFPNTGVYSFILIVTNISLIYSIMKKDVKKQYKIVNIISSCLLNIFLIILIELISRNSINIFDSINMFANSTILVLLQLSTGIFVSWILSLLFISASYKLKKYDKDEKLQIPELIFDE